MAEEQLTVRAIEELTNATNSLSNAIQTSNSSFNELLISLIPAIAVITGVVFAIFKFNHTENQKQNSEFMKQLEYYDTQFIELAAAFPKNGMYMDCVINLRVYLSVLNRISYLKINGLVDDKFIQFFESRFHSGIMYLKWLEFTNKSSGTYSNTFLHFEKVKDTVDYSNANVILSPRFYYYANKIHEDSEYDPVNDDTDPAAYTIQDEDILLLDEQLIDRAYNSE